MVNAFGRPVQYIALTYRQKVFFIAEKDISTLNNRDNFFFVFHRIRKSQVTIIITIIVIITIAITKMTQYCHCIYIREQRMRKLVTKIVIWLTMQ